MKANQLPTITNSQTYRNLAPGTWKFATDLIVKRQMGAEYGALYNNGTNPDEMALSNAALDAIPDYVTPSSGGQACALADGATMAFQGSGVVNP